MRFRKLRIAWSVGVVFVYLLYPGTFSSSNPPPLWFTLGRYWMLSVPVAVLAAISWLPWHFNRRNLRIAWSVAWGLAAVLMIVWIRIGDYWHTHTAIRYREPLGYLKEPNSNIFGWHDDGLIIIPSNLLPIIIALACCFYPWVYWSKRFSLRTLLIATTLVAVVLGLVVWAAR
jgi:hypothetical protein